MTSFNITGSPHIHARQDVRRIMWSVVVALLPAMLVSFWIFGLGAVFITAVSVLSCVLFEFLIQKFLLRGSLTLPDGSAIITGILLAFNVPSNLPVWELILGALVAIGVAKMSFGGLGKNLFNPALTGRVFLLVSFPADMMTWPLPSVNRMALLDAVTGPTALGSLKEGLRHGETVTTIMQKVPNWHDMLIGNMGGSVGEISAIALIAGGLFLLLRKIIRWHIPVTYIATVALFTGILWWINPEKFASPVFHLLSGGLMLGAIFMATDLVTSPVTKRGMLIFGLGCGILTVVIRIWGAYPEGVSFAILLMNAFTPLLNKIFKPKRYGT
jgi:Na+-translocating ferredoxin:NAD+ oxidoreductase subunit D